MYLLCVDQHGVFALCLFLLSSSRDTHKYKHTQKRTHHNYHPPLSSTGKTREFVQRFADSYVQTANAARTALGDTAPSDYALAPPAAALNYELAPPAADPLPSDYAQGVAAAPSQPVTAALAPSPPTNSAPGGGGTPTQGGTATAVAAAAGGPYCPIPDTTTPLLQQGGVQQQVGVQQQGGVQQQVLAGAQEQDLERLVVDLLAQGQVGQAQAVARLLQQQRGMEQPLATRSFEEDSSDDESARVWPQPRPAYDAAAATSVAAAAAGGAAAGRPQSPVGGSRVRPAAAAIPTAPAADDPPAVGTSFTPVMASRATLPARPSPEEESVVGTSFVAVPQGGLEGPLVLPEEEAFDAEFWDMAAVPPRAPGGDGGRSSPPPPPPARMPSTTPRMGSEGPSQDTGAPAVPEAGGDRVSQADIEALNALEAQVAVALEEEAQERLRTKKLQEQLERTTAAVAELQVCLGGEGVGEGVGWQG